MASKTWFSFSNFFAYSLLGVALVAIPSSAYSGQNQEGKSLGGYVANYCWQRLMDTFDPMISVVKTVLVGTPEAKKNPRIQNTLKALQSLDDYSYTESELLEILQVIERRKSDWHREETQEDAILKMFIVNHKPVYVSIDRLGNIIVNFESIELGRGHARSAVSRFLYDSSFGLEPVVILKPIDGHETAGLEDSVREQNVIEVLPGNRRGLLNSKVAYVADGTILRKTTKVIVRPRCSSNLSHILSYRPDPVGLLPILGDVAAGLRALHHLNIVHRDLKPQNIFVLEDRGYLSDFGISKKTKDLNGKFAGTFSHSDPLTWVLYGETRDTLAKSSDLYSFGLVILESLFGLRPIVADGEGSFHLLPAENCIGEYTTFKRYKGKENKTNLPSTYHVKSNVAEESGLSACMQEYGLRTYNYLQNYLAKRDQKCFRAWEDKSMTNDCLPAIALDCLSPMVDKRTKTADSILKRIDRISGISVNSDL